MKLSLRLLSLLMCLAFLLGSISVALADNQGLYAFVKTNRAALYSNSTMKTRSMYLQKYELVTVLANDGVKAQVQYGSKTGYIYVKYLAGVTPINEKAYINRDTKVYMRPYTSSQSTKVSKNTAITVLMYNGSWAMIEKDGLLAYIQKAFLSDSIDSGATPLPEMGRYDYSLSGTVTECDFQATVNVSSLSVYSKASASSSKLGTIKRNTVVNVYAFNSSWAYIELNGRYGYCRWAYLKRIASSDVLLVTPAPTSTIPSSYTLDTAIEAKANAKIKVYETPSLSGKYLGYVAKGTSVYILAYNDNWAYISLNGKYGYTKKTGLTPVAADVTPTPTPAPTPTPTPSPTPTPVYSSTDEIFLNTSTTNEEKVYEFFTSRTTYNEAVACGLLANMKQESNFNPESGKGKNYQGICQWSTSRFAILTNWCEQNGYNPYSLEGQCKFLWYDLSQRYTVYHKALMNIENTAQGAYDAGYYFCYYYERPANLESSSAARGTKARDIYWVKYAH
ncbi:MAG: SH3 domain-containing protein [Clostridia bacterium]|nr:SH3 domain-containing protein [Clostridia bacterium]